MKLYFKTLLITGVIFSIFLSACGSIILEQPASISVPIEEIEENIEVADIIEEPGYYVTIYDIDGKVYTKQANHTDFSEAENGLTIYQEGIIKTGDDGRAKLEYSDGTIVRIGPNSLLALAEVEEEEDGELFKNIVLEAGQVWIALNGGSLEVDTKSGVASVRGSYLSVEFDAETGFIYITCLEGTCTLGEGDDQVTLGAGETAAIDVPGLAPFLEAMSIEDFEAWLQNSPEAIALLLEFTECVNLVEGDISSDALWNCYISLGNEDFAPADGVIGDYVWEDEDGDGVQDDFEPPMVEVPVTLFNIDNQVIEIVFTDENGHYLFDNIAAGKYYLQFTAPEGYVFTLLDEGEDDEIDNDADSKGFTEPFLLPSETFSDHLDAGLVYPGSAGAICPLTGEQIGDEALLLLRPLFISISHFPAGATRPSTGINSAPVVFESIIDEGQTRLQALFYCTYPSELPSKEDSTADGSADAGQTYQIEGVRSGRVFYGEYAKLFNAGLIFSAADPSVLAQILPYTCRFAAASDENDIGSNGLNINTLIATASECTTEAGNTDLGIWNFGPPSPGGEPLTNFLMFYNYWNQTRWDYSAGAGGYVRSQNTPTAPKEFTVSTDRLTGEANVRQNVLILITPHTVLNHEGTIIEFSLTNIRGNGYLLRDGLKYRICWSTVNGDYEEISDLYRPFLIYDCETKEEISLSQGSMWINVVDVTTGFSYIGDYWTARHFQPTYNP